VLAYLMESHQLRQADLPEVGNQPVVSQVLSGKRRLNARQIAALARRFNVSADVFLDEARAAAWRRIRYSMRGGKAQRAHTRHDAHTACASRLHRLHALRNCAREGVTDS
jgi:transcriptional regulator with XRE-family HTH domain